MLVTPTAAGSLPWGLAWRLALGQVVSWGILYYAFTVVAEPLHQSTGWSRTFVNVGLSAGLLAWGLASVPVGGWIQRRGARELMALSSVVGGGALILLGTTDGPFAYIAAWVLLGLAMAGALYDPAFAAITAAFGSEYRRGITFLTLVAGFASTLFIPLAQLAVSEFGWRTALVALGTFQGAIGLPLHWFGLPRQSPSPAAPTATWPSLRSWLRQMAREVCDARFVGLAIWFSGHAAAATGLVFLLIPLLQSRDVPTPTILQAVALLGPMQVLGRFVLTAWGGKFSALAVGRWAMAALLGGVAMLVLCPWNLLTLGAFTALFGLGNGVLTIVRGTVVAEFFGRARYAELNGALAAPGILAKAGAPLALGALWSATGAPAAVVVACAALLLASAGGLWLAGSQREASGDAPVEAAA